MQSGEVAGGVGAKESEIDRLGSWFVVFPCGFPAVFRQDEILFHKCLHVFFSKEVDGSTVEEECTFHTAGAAFIHSSPVVEDVTDERVGRHGGDGVVEVSDFDGGERHLFDDAVHV